MIQLNFEKGTDAAGYLADLKSYRSVVRSLVTAAKADPLHVSALSKAAASYAQPVRASAMTEDWCGDSACVLPILTELFSGADIPFTVFHGSEYTELESHYHGLGVDHIPVISFWDGTGAEIGRWIECPAAVEERKDRWKADRPEFMELYAKRNTDKDAARKFASLYREFVETMAEWYKGGMWTETTREVVDILKG